MNNNNNKNLQVYAIDDDQDSLDLLAHQLKDLPIQLNTEQDSDKALKHLSQDILKYEAIILDWNMPQISGLELLHTIQQQSQTGIIPVIMLTARSDPADINQGIQQGALYYLIKPVGKKELVASIYSVAHQTRKIRELRKRLEYAFPINLMQQACFKMRTMQDVRTLEKALASVCTDPFHAAIGLNELLTNAIEHGNLGIDFQTKSKMIAEGNYATRLDALSKESRLYANVLVTIDENRIEFDIQDQGQGFDYTRFLTLKSSAAFQLHGRGIHIANHICFSELEYLGTGNRVQARIFKSQTQAE